MDQDPTTVNQETAPVADHEVDSNYTKRDIKIPREKKRTGLIVSIIVAVLVVVLGGLALWFCLWYSNPEQVAYDAMQNLFKAENVGLEGGFVITNPSQDDALQTIFFEFDSAANRLPASASAKVTFIFNPEVVEGDPRVSIEVKNIIMQDGVLYLQFAGLMDSINSLELDEDTRAEMEVYLQTLEVIDNEWWRISLPELLETMEVPEEQSNAVTEVYGCAVQAMNGDMSGEMATIYKQNRFIKVETSKRLEPEEDSGASEIAAGHKAYELTLDKAKLADFVNQLPETETAQEFFACYNRVAEKYGGETIDSDDIDEIDADDVDWPESDNVRVFLEISQWGHQLRSAHVYAYDDDGESVGSGAVLFKYDAVTVSAPESYRPITELFEELAEMFVQLFSMSVEGNGEISWD